MQYFNIQVASQLSGVASATIRAWEKRYNAVIPERAENKHRLYSETDIEKLALLYKLTEFGQSIGKIAHLELPELKNVYTTLLHRPYDERQVVTPNHDKIDFEKILGNLILALEAYKIDIISHELEKAKSLLTPRDICLNIIHPLFQMVGNRVVRNELTIAQEHTLSSLISFHIGQIIGQQHQKGSQKEKLVLITTPEGELHEIGIINAALLCVHYGVKFIYLGVDLPSNALIEAIHSLHPSAVLLGMTHERGQEEKRFHDYINNVTSHLNGRTELWIGGNLKSELHSELEKKRIPFFPTYHALDQYLANF